MPKTFRSSPTAPPSLTAASSPPRSAARRAPASSPANTRTTTASSTTHPATAPSSKRTAPCSRGCSAAGLPHRPRRPLPPRLRHLRHHTRRTRYGPPLPAAANPPGVDDWYGYDAYPTHYFSAPFSDNGDPTSSATYKHGYITRAIDAQARDFIAQSAPSEQPFFLWLAEVAPHCTNDPPRADCSAGAPATEPGTYKQWADEPLPEPPSFNEELDPRQARLGPLPPPARADSVKAIEAVLALRARRADQRRPRRRQRHPPAAPPRRARRHRDLLHLRQRPASTASTASSCRSSTPTTRRSASP